MSKRVLRAAGSLAVLLLFFFSTLRVLDYTAPRWRNKTRLDDARAIRAALTAYYKDNTAYPGPADIPAEKLGAFLVAKYLHTVPSDPLGISPYAYQYVSDGKTFYGLLLHLEPDGSGCLVGTDIENNPVFGHPQAPACPL
jgi:hypothetical protein